MPSASAATHFAVLPVRCVGLTESRDGLQLRCRGTHSPVVGRERTCNKRLVADGKMRCTCGTEHKLTDMLAALADGDIASFNETVRAMRGRVAMDRARKAALFTADFCAHIIVPDPPPWIYKNIGLLFDWGFVPLFVPCINGWVLAAEISPVSRSRIVNAVITFRDETSFLESQIREVLRKAATVLKVVEWELLASGGVCRRANIDLARSGQQWREMKLGLYAFQTCRKIDGNAWVAMISRADTEWIRSLGRTTQVDGFRSCQMMQANAQVTLVIYPSYDTNDK